MAPRCVLIIPIVRVQTALTFVTLRIVNPGDVTNEAGGRPGPGYVLRISRPSRWLVTTLPFAAGFLATADSLHAVFWVGLVYFALPYNLLFRGLDKVSIAGPQSFKKVSRIIIWILLLNVPLLVALVANSPPPARLWLGAVVVAAMAYGMKAVRFKEMPLLDSLTGGFLIVSPLVFALLVNGWQSLYLPAVVALSCWGVACHSFGTIRYMDIDKQAGLGTTATLLGSRNGTFLSFLLFVISAGILAVHYGQWGALAAIVLALYVINVARFIGVKNPELFESGWRMQLKLNYLAAIVSVVFLYWLGSK